MRDEGHTMQVIADTVGLSKGRVCKILAELDEEIDNDGYRGWLRAQGEKGLEKIQEILRKPPPVKVSAGGKVMYYPDADDPSGRTPDYTKPIYDDAIHIDAVKALPSLLDRLSKLHAVDARPSKEDGAEYVEDYKEWVYQVLADNNKLVERLKAHGEYAELAAPGSFEEFETVYEAEVISSPSPDDSSGDSR